MTRMFTGGRDSGGGGNTNPLFDRYEKRSAKETFIRKMRGIDDKNLTPEEKYKQIFDKKVNDLRSKALSGNKQYSFSLPGTEGGEEKKLSKTVEAFIQKMAQKQAKEEEKKLRERAKIQVSPRAYMGMQGGRIDKKGRIYGPDNRWVASVNMKSGKIMSRSGFRIGKYDPKSPYTDYLITQFIAKEYAPGKASFMGGSAGWGGLNSGGSGGGMGNFYGGGDDKSSGNSWNSFWG